MIEGQPYPSEWTTGITTATQRAAAVGLRGMVATGHPLATHTGLTILEAGGNAVDAAIAAAGMCAVAQPMMSGVGGDAFLIYWDATRSEVWAINGAGAAPQAATLEWFRAAGFAAIPHAGMLSVTVPGAVGAYHEALRRWGTKPLAELWEPAIGYAADGIPITERVSEWIAAATPRLKRFPASAEIYLPAGRPPKVGERLYQRDLARSLAIISEGGADVFYRGEIAKSIATHSRAESALLSEADLAEHVPAVYTPIQTSYRGTDVFETAPPSQGYILLQMLNLMEQFNLSGSEDRAVDRVHVMVEAKKIAFADRDSYFGDPSFLTVPLERVLSKRYASSRKQDVAPDRAGGKDSTVRPEATDTTYLCVVDSHGNAISLVASLSAAFGCADVVPGTGIFLNNRGGHSFNLTSGHPNCLAPGKRPMHTLNCFVVLRGRQLWLVGGTAGGDAQPQWNAQILSYVIDSGLNVQQAIEAPRWWSLPGTEPGYREKPPILVIEEGFGELTLSELARRGHTIMRVPHLYVGSGFQCISRDPDTGSLMGGTDNRGEGCALGI